MIRAAEKCDLPAILELYSCARTFMAQNGNPSQWGTTFPPKELLIQDIVLGNLYVYEMENKICGVFSFIVGEDPTYCVIKEGRWISDEPYGAIHRVASDGTTHGFLGKCVEFCTRTISHLRIDTHEDNKIMQKALAKNGFQKCGIIYTDDGTPRIAYERT